MEKLERLSWDTANFLKRKGYMRLGMDYPRWKSIVYGSKHTLSLWHYCKKHNYQLCSKQALHVIAMQPFSGLRPEWVESNLPWR